MSCCGRQRAALRTQMARPNVAWAEPAPPVLQEPVRLAHRGTSSTMVRGERTGLTYLFGPHGGTLDVDGRDAGALLASGRFLTSR
jgi:hypothetical protein